MTRRFALFAATVVLSAACERGLQGRDARLDDRAEQLATWFALEDSVLVASRPHQLALRFDEMQRSPFRFLRGSEALFWRDLRDPADAWAATRFRASSASFVLLQGDAHPENIGTYGERGDQRVEFNDFDAAGFGPFHWEVRRAAASLAVALREAGSPPDLVNAAVRALADSYVAQIDAPVPATGLGYDNVGVVLRARLDKAAGDGEARVELTDFTVVEGGIRRFVRGGTAADDPREALIDADASVVGQLPIVLDAYRATLGRDVFPPGYFAMKDAARRCGQGVGSLTSVRLYVLVEGATNAPDDDIVLQVKEATDATVDRGLVHDETARTAAARVVERTRILQSRPDADSLLGYGDLFGVPVVIGRVTGFQKSIRVAKDLQRVSTQREPLVEFGRDTGRLLASAHARGTTWDGWASQPLILGVIGERGEEFADETSTFALRYADQVAGDHGRFEALRESLGPWLGMRPPNPSVARGAQDPAGLLDPPCP